MQFRNIFNFCLSACVLYSAMTLVPFLYRGFVLFSATLVGINLVDLMMKFTRKYFLHRKVCPENRAILITGCDSGFGNALARRMDALGYVVYATCLIPEGEGAKRLSRECSEKLRVLRMDVTDDQSIQRAKDAVEKSLGQNCLWTVVNNAGIGHSGLVDWTPLEDLRRVYEVNAAGMLRVVKAFLPFIKKSKGRFVNITSTAGKYHMAGIVGYCMSKSAAIALTTGLRMELAKWGATAISIEPFFYSTPLTGPQSLASLTDKSWEAAPAHTREEYGEDYIRTYKKVSEFSVRLMCNRNIYEVIDCVEDAITAEEPLSTYFPCGPFLKLLLILVYSLPHWFNELFVQYFLDLSAKPKALLERAHRKEE